MFYFKRFKLSIMWQSNQLSNLEIFIPPIDVSHLINFFVSFQSVYNKFLTNFWREEYLGSVPHDSSPSRNHIVMRKCSDILKYHDIYISFVFSIIHQNAFRSLTNNTIFFCQNNAYDIWIFCPGRMSIQEPFFYYC